MRPMAANARLAPLPEQRPLRRRRAPCGSRTRRARGRAPRPRRASSLDLRRDPVELDEQHGARARRVAGRGTPPRPPAIVSRSIISIAAGRIPGRDDPRDGVARGVDDVERGEQRARRPPAARTIRSVTSVAMPSVPSEPTITPSRSGPSRRRAPAAERRRSSPSGRTTSSAGDVVDREAVLEAVRAAGVLGDVAADRADLLARRVGRVEVALAPRRRVVTSRFVDARLDDDALAGEVDLEDPVHPRDARSRSRPRPAARRRRGRCRRRARRTARASRRAEPDDGLHLLRRAGQHDRSSAARASPVSPSQSYVASCSGSVITYASPSAAAKLVDEAGGKRHGAILLAAMTLTRQHRSSMIAGFV